MTDCLDGKNLCLTVGQCGVVKLIDVMPRILPSYAKSADYAIVEAARVSYGPGTEKVNDDISLIRYLMRHNHTSPFEMCEVKFYFKLPIFVARQMVRHRTASINESSARYSEMIDDFFVPAEPIRAQSSSNRQGSEGVVECTTDDAFRDYVDANNSIAYDTYRDFLSKGVSRELARIIMPLTTCTSWYWKIDLHNLFHFLELRLDAHAQEEIRVYAQAIFNIVKEIFPVSCKAFEEYRLGSVTLSALELKALKTDQPLASENRRECLEWDHKKKHYFSHD